MIYHYAHRREFLPDDFFAQRGRCWLELSLIYSIYNFSQSRPHEASAAKFLQPLFLHVYLVFTAVPRKCASLPAFHVTSSSPPFSDHVAHTLAI